MFEYFCWASNGKIEIMEVKNQAFFLFVNETSTIFSVATWSQLTIETVEQLVKYVKSYQ